MYMYQLEVLVYIYVGLILKRFHSNLYLYVS